jgi:glutamyl-tRNA synthetase
MKSLIKLNYLKYFSIKSQRTELYKEKVNQILTTDSAYRCFCSETRINLLRKEALKNREIPKYDNRCRALTQKEINEKLSNGSPYTVRLKLKEGPITFDDMVFGPLTFDLSSCESDPIIFKTDGFPTYHFANVVDDHYMGITHVLRGAEWQVSTPKHLMMYEAFGWEPPKYAHLPLILNKDGTKLSKRQNDIRIDYYKDNGYYSDAILNYLTSIGGGFGRQDVDNIYKLEDLIRTFDIKKLVVNNCKIETDKLKLYNRLYIRTNSNNECINKLIEELKSLLISKFGSNQNLNLDEEYLKFMIHWSKVCLEY